MVQSKEEKALKKKESDLLKKLASKHFKTCMQCNTNLHYKNIGGVSTNVCNKCIKIVEKTSVLKYCKDCETSKSLDSFSKKRTGYTVMCKACEDIEILPTGMKRCSNNEKCVHPEGPVLPDTIEYFSEGKNQCRQCKNEKNRENSKEGLGKFVGTNCNKCNAIILEVGDNRKECSSCRADRKKKKHEHSQEEINAFIARMCTRSKKCIKCNIFKPMGEFKLRTDSQNLYYRDYCKLCCSIKPRVEDILNYIESTKNTKKMCSECGETKLINQFRIDYDRRTLCHRNKCMRCSNTLGKDYRSVRNKFYYSNVEGIFDIYRTCAKLKGLEFNDSLIINLIQSSCGYCGKQVKYGDMDFRIKGEYNGIDRIDNTKGYIEGNVIACCSMCNYMKKDADISSFIRKVCEIHKVDSGDYRLKYHSGIILCGNSCDFKQYKYSSKSREYSFELTEKQFNDIVSKKCFYCNRTNKEEVIGTDRLDNSIGYNLRNCVPCCSYCNYMKNNYSLEEFLEKIEDIVNYTKDNEQIKNLCENNKEFKKPFGKE